MSDSVLPGFVDLAGLDALLRRGAVDLADCRTPGEYAAGHLPEAVNLDTYGMHWHDSSPGGIVRYTRAAAAVCKKVGLHPKRPVVCHEAITGMSAARGAWMLDYLGFESVYILNGGLNAWTAAKRALSTRPVRPKPSRFSVTPRRELLAGFSEVLAALPHAHAKGYKSPPGDTAVILDCRSREEREGTRVRSARGGSIPGSVHLEWLLNLGPSGALKSAEDLRKLYSGCGVTPDKNIIAYCHGGYRSAHTLWVLRGLGYPRLRNYLGSWGEWGNRAELPVRAGGS